jgi:acetoacetate decarboxylase
MGFVKSLEEVAKSHQGYLEFYDAEMLTVFFVTRQEVSQKLLPPPLKPAAMPLGYAFLANYPKTDFGVAYLESALFLAAEFNGEMGLYCLSMPVTNDMALILGRETFGYPKKMANIRLKRDGSEVDGWADRHGVRLLDVRAKLTGTFNDEAALGMMKARLESNPDAIVFNYKYFQAPNGKGFDYNPRLVREVVKLSRKSMEFGQADIVVRSSDHDPWGEIEIVKVLGATYTVSNNTMLPGAVVAEVDQDEFAPYAFMKLDALLLPSAVGEKK